MTDSQGNTVNVGDTVAYILGASNSPSLRIGQVTKIYPNDKRCSVDNHPNIFKNRILLLKENNPQITQEELRKAIHILQNYCDTTHCCNCTIKTDIGCSLYGKGCGVYGKTNIPHTWEQNQVKD